MALSPEEKKYYEGQMQAWLKAASPDPKLRFEERNELYDKAGALGEYFKGWEATQREIFEKSNDPESRKKSDYVKRLNDFIDGERKKKSKEITDVYMSGLENARSTSISLNPGEAYHLVSGIWGGHNVTGTITGFLSKIPVVGEWMVAIGEVIGSWMKHLFDKNEPIVGFSEALQNVKDTKYYGGGIQALAPIIGAQNAGQLFNDLKGGKLPEPQPKPNPKPSAKPTGTGGEHTFFNSHSPSGPPFPAGEPPVPQVPRQRA